MYLLFRTHFDKIDTIASQVGDLVSRNNFKFDEERKY